MKITTDLIQKLRTKTGAGMMDCKKYLEKTKGDLDKAVELFRKEGQKVASKKQDRNTEQGMIDAYIHPGSKIGVLVEVNCETDFVARNEDFKNFVHDLAMHIAAFDPQYLDVEDVPEAEVNKEKEIFQEQLKKEKKPEQAWEKIIEGKLGKFYSEVCLMKQPFLKDDKKTVVDFINENISALGENIKVKNFTRYAL